MAQGFIVTPAIMESVEITVTFSKIFIFRLWLCKLLMKLAIIAGGFGKIEFVEAEDK